MKFSARVHRVAATLEAALDLLEGGRGKALAVATLPTHTDILGAALDATGHREAWEDGSLGDRDALDLLHAVRLEGRRWLRGEAEGLLAEVAPEGTKALLGGVREAVGGFFKRAGRYVRELFAAGVLAVAGPDLSVLDDPVVQAAIDEHVAEQIPYLEAFEERIVSEARPLGPAFVANAEMYGSAVYGAASEIQRKRIIAAGVKKHERRVLGAVEHCDDCPPLAEKGWQPIGTLPRIGFKNGTDPSQCLSNCTCHFEFR